MLHILVGSKKQKGRQRDFGREVSPGMGQDLEDDDTINSSVQESGCGWQKWREWREWRKWRKWQDGDSTVCGGFVVWCIPMTT
ncbi:hypothetical protein AOQ84DRAFT_144933 [Glonium stellatum]|uniref:Uncharacterized protein n=1 Tax=Glonium stellatum TaxID=574774 RepID=A0A8E2ERH1_9PEZI|nr:hypothetical protein AOQ84DRAFT_144933 [Glonium stellatum]